MSFELTTCGHLKVDLKGNPQYCKTCDPASQKQVPASQKQTLSEQEQQAAEELVEMLKPIISKCVGELSMPLQQVGGNLLGIAIAICIESGVPRNQVVGLVDSCYEVQT